MREIMSVKLGGKGNVKTALRCIIMILILTIVLTGSVFAKESINNKESAAQTIDVQYLEQLIEMIKVKYKGEIDENQLMEGAVRGILNTLDPYSTFFDKEEYQSFTTNVDGEYQGIGVMITQHENYIVVSKVFPGSPAEKAGVKSGDFIVSIDGKSMVNGDVDAASSLMLGKSGSKVSIGLLRQGVTDNITVEIERGLIRINPVSYEIMEGNIGYIKFEVFNKNSYEYMKQALDAMDEKKVEKIVLDLRNNPGGILDQAVDIAKHFVPEGLIVTIDNKEEEDEKYYSELRKLKYKTVVLVNGMSASASEVLAGAIQDTKAGTLVGTKTFGKAKVQVVIPVLDPEAYRDIEKKTGKKVINAYDLFKLNVMPDKGDILGYTKLTIAEYLTPGGRMIDGQGITPDILVELPKDIKVDPGSLQKLGKTGKYNLNDESLEIYNAEKVLYMAGYEIDIPDLKMDEKTYDAIMKFQTDSELSPYGTIDFATQDALNKKVDELKLIYDTQLAKAVELLNK